MKYFKKLVGDHIYLSPISTEDAEKFAEWLNDFETTDYIGRSSKIITLESEKKYLEEHLEAEAKFAILCSDHDELIGTVGLEQIDHLNRRATLGIFIGEKKGRNKGYGTEAIRMILEYGFRYMNLNNIKLDVLAFNKRAIACYTKCGFKEYGRRRKSEFLYGQYYDRIEMDILAEEFEGDFIRNKNIV